MNTVQQLKERKEKLSDDIAEVIERFYQEVGTFDIKIEVSRFVKFPGDPEPEAIVNVTLEL